MEEISLYIVPTPIGNLEDITARALRILNEVDTILAEDTRNTGKLLKHFDIKSNLQSHHAFNEHKTVEGLLQRLQKGEKIALVSDAGTPVISDPGYMLVRACGEADIKVETLPGPTAFVPALVNSGLPADRFTFEGFLPHKKGRQTKITELAEEQRTMVFYESPHRLVKFLEQLSSAWGEERKASVSRELSKLHEETKRGSLKELAEYYTEVPPKGEIVVVVEGKKVEKKPKGNKYKYKDEA
ncbi:16S rRNA (cytidine(1402)-2'-O)-methyltransferase [Flammeovirga agarivorans]|uniref:Ribosomal RNA small subunit methyltransferase I n=1 Tax=Flammeovirga agarivorans TaxID=2726742 RepID=A0A7X8XTV6_9BACT|nr:16S rRNA (cytidine(1402)-2'-O)-methyltransferase [Flammeovirga agarivorans]NLR89644.1 16S rRNA (cytidine(1402)-2'-O)-methyltransferase [Flammeovirga agarivorans]